MSFSAKPGDPGKEWASGAPVGTKRAPDQAPLPPPPSLRPWEKLDPKAPATKAFNLRLNEYEIELLRAVAESEFCSQQAMAKRILIRALQDLAKELK